MTLKPTLEPLAPSPATPPIEAGLIATAPAPQAAPRRRRRRLVRLATLVLFMGLCALGVWYCGFHEPEPRDDVGRFQGEWKLTSVGAGDAEAEAAPTGVRISGDRWRYLIAGRDGGSFAITLNETTTPKQIDLTLLDAEGKPVGKYGSHGIYETVDRTIQIRVEPVTRPRPQEFTSPDAVVWTLTRTKLQQRPENTK